MPFFLFARHGRVLMGDFIDLFECLNLNIYKRLNVYILRKKVVDNVDALGYSFHEEVKEYKK